MKFCPTCQYIGNGKRRGSFLIGGVLIGLALIIYGIPSQEFGLTSIFFSVLFLFLGILTIILYKSYGNICPNCYNRDLISVDGNKASEIINNDNYNSKASNISICTSCHFRALQDKKHSLLGSVLIIVFGILTLPIGLYNSAINHSTFANLMIFIGSLIIIATGIYGLSANVRKRTTCPSCKNKSFIPINSKLAKSLTNEKNLSTP
jgi:hypothetical protein